jgi:predicted phosphoribosyltransferase
VAYKFKDRTEAGQKLAEALSKYKEKNNILLLALPRGGIPVAYEIAKALSLPLDILLVRKLGVPGHEEFAMGAIAWDNELEAEVDEVVCLYTPEPFYGVGQWYKDFSQTSDSEVQDILRIFTQKS